MTAVNKIDSNQTELRIAEEVSVGVLPVTPVWVQMDPNDYSTFGGKIKTVARNPINSSRQRKKGVVVDLDASGGFGIDLTQDNMQSLVQGFLFADMRTNNELSLTQVTGASHEYNPASGGAGFLASDLLFAKGALNAVNNGLKTVSSSTGTTVVVSDTGLVDENGSAIVISKVGRSYASGVLQVDASGALPKLTASGIVAAHSAYTTTGVFSDGDTVTIGTKVYTIQAALTDADGHVKLGAAGSAALTLANLTNAINRNGVGVAGTDFALSTVANTDVTASTTSSVMTVTAIVGGTVGNSIVTSDTGANASWTAGTLASGTGVSFKSLGLIVGEWVCIGDDPVGDHFATAANNGLKRIRVIADGALTFDKSTLAMVNDTGVGKTVSLFFGRVCKNELGALVKRRSYQLERSLGAPDDGSANVQSEYLTGSIPDTMEFDVKQGDKITLKLNFMSRDHETRTADDGLKPGTRPTLQDADAFNATSNVLRLSMAGIDPASANPVDLFAFLTDLKMTIDNGVKANKAIKFLGAFDNTAGTLTVSASSTAYFADVAAIQAVRDNADVTLDMTFGSENKGITIDMPLVSVGNALADVKQDEAIMIPIDNDAATGAKLDVNLNYTVLFQFWDYLPDLAA